MMWLVYPAESEYLLGFGSGAATFRRFGLWFWFRFRMCPWFGAAATTATTARAATTPDTKENIVIIVIPIIPEQFM